MGLGPNEGTVDPGSVSGTAQDLPSTQSPFAWSRRYRGQWRVQHPISRPYPAFIARTGSCASPIPSRQLGITLA
jgi:hypothetical protein